MKIAVFSDIHGNLKALKNVLAQIKEQNVDKVVFLGDIFQRGNEELECLDLIKENKIICVKGNCEFYLQYGIDIDTGVEHLRAYYDTTRVKLSDEQMQFVKDMPLYYVNECNGHKIRFSHFLFADINAPYPFLQLSDLKNGVFDNACLSEEVKAYDLVVVGHSHQNFVKENVVSVSASGLEGASYLLIEDNLDGVTFKHVNLVY